MKIFHFENFFINEIFDVLVSYSHQLKQVDRNCCYCGYS